MAEGQSWNRKDKKQNLYNEKRKGTIKEQDEKAEKRKTGSEKNVDV